MENIYDLIILGAGPTGLYSCYLAKEKKLNTLLIETSNSIGGQLPTLSPYINFLFRYKPRVYHL